MPTPRAGRCCVVITDFAEAGGAALDLGSLRLGRPGLRGADGLPQDKAAEQFGMQRPGQYLPGGMDQLFIGVWESAFKDGAEWIVREGKTGWTDLKGVGYAAGNIQLAAAARVQRLAQDEDQSKRPAAAGAH